MLPLYKPDDYKRVLETALLVAAEPLPLSELKKLFDQEFDLSLIHIYYRSRIACFSDIREVVLQECGHNLHHDQPQQVARLIEEFFAA